MAKQQGTTYARRRQYTLAEPTRVQHMILLPVVQLQCIQLQTGLRRSMMVNHDMKTEKHMLLSLTYKVPTTSQLD